MSARKQSIKQQKSVPATVNGNGKSASELGDEALDKVVGGTSTLMKACTTGQHLPEAKLTT